MFKPIRRPTNTRKLFQKINVSKVKSTFFGYAYKMIIPFKEGPLTKEEIKKNIKANPQFCGDGSSITTADLASYLNNNTVIYHYKDSKLGGHLGGVLVIGPKSKSLYIHGICVPKEFKGVGKKLMSVAKQIARDNGFTSIRLECYGEVHMFYEKQGYKIIEQKELSNSNSNDEIIKYIMEYTIGESSRTPRSSGSRTPRTPRTPRISRKSYPSVENINR